MIRERMTQYFGAAGCIYYSDVSSSSVALPRARLPATAGQSLRSYCEEAAEVKSSLQHASSSEQFSFKKHGLFLQTGKFTV